MKPRTVKELLALGKRALERQAPKRHSAETPECQGQGWKLLQDYANKKTGLDKAQLEHVKDCRFCLVRVAAFAGLTREEAKAQLEADYAALVEAAQKPEEFPIPPMLPQIPAPQTEPTKKPSKRRSLIPRFARRSKVGVAEAGEKVIDVSFTWRREAEMVAGRLYLEPQGEKQVMPRMFLDPAPETPIVFVFRCGDDVERLLSVNESGWSDWCDAVTTDSLKTDPSLEPPDGDIEW